MGGAIMEPLLGLRSCLQIKGAFMLSFLLSVVVISLSGVMMPGPLFAVTVAKSYKSQFAGVQIAAGYALVEIPLILLIYFGLGRFFQHELVQLTLSLLGGVVLLGLGIGIFRARTRVVATGRSGSQSIR